MKAIDMHCDTIMKIYLDDQLALAENDCQIDLVRMKKSGTVLQNFAMFVPLSETQDPYGYCMAMIDVYDRELAKNSEQIGPVTKYSDYLANQKAGRLSGVLTMEEGAPLQGSLASLQEFYDRGVRMLTLTWNFENEIGFPNSLYFDEAAQTIATEQKGLTPQGIKIVQKMNELGMIIDVSHGSDQLVRDVLTYTDRPFVASHSNAREVCFHSRNLPDELIKKIAERGGVIGLNYCEDFIRPQGSSQSLVAGLIAHAKHIVAVGGIECLGLGSDFDGIDPNPELADILAVEKIHQGLRAAGFSTAEVEKIFYRNVERLYQEFLV